MNRLKNDCFDNLEKIVYMKPMDLLELFWTEESGFERDVCFYLFLKFFFLDLKANIP